MRRRSERERGRALLLRADGLTIRAIASDLGVPLSTVSRWLRGRGDAQRVRECALCGERFIAVSARHRFCSPAHARKHWQVFGAPATLDALREHAQALEAKRDQLRRRLAAGHTTVSGTP